MNDEVAWSSICTRCCQYSIWNREATSFKLFAQFWKRSDMESVWINFSRKAPCEQNARGVDRKNLLDPRLCRSTMTISHEIRMMSRSRSLRVQFYLQSQWSEQDTCMNTFKRTEWWLILFILLNQRERFVVVDEDHVHLFVSKRTMHESKERIRYFDWSFNGTTFGKNDKSKSWFLFSFQKKKKSYVNDVERLNLQRLTEFNFLATKAIVSLRSEVTVEHNWFDCSCLESWWFDRRIHEQNLRHEF